MTVYLDVVLIENLCMNYIILFATAYIVKIKINHLRLIISSLIGALYSVLMYLNVLPIYSNIFMKIILSIVMIYIAYNGKSFKNIAKQIVIFYLTSFVFGGCAFALLYFIKPQNILMKDGVFVGTYPLKIALLGGIIGFIITHIAFKIVKNRMSEKDIIYEIQIAINNKKINVKAMLDTGNMLRDPITKTPVIVVEKEKLYELLPNKILDNINKIIGGDEENIISLNEQNYMSRLKIIPFNSIGKQNGLMLGFKADEIKIVMDDEIETVKNIIVGVFDKKFSKNNSYSALIGLDVLEGSEKNEHTTNLKV